MKKAASVRAAVAAAGLALASLAAAPVPPGSDTDAGRGTIAIVAGTDSPDTVVENANVHVNGASGVLVAPDLVLTNAHVAAVPLPDEDPEFSLTDRAYPDRWYDIPAGSVWMTVGTAHFGGGAFPVHVDGRPAVTSRTRLRLNDLNGGVLRHGDRIGLKTSNRRYLFVRGGALGGAVEIDWLYERFGPWQTLTVEKVTPGPPEIATGNVVALRALDGSYLAPRPRDARLEATAGPRSQRHDFNLLRLGSTSGLVRHDDEIVLIASADARRRWVQYPLLQFGLKIAVPGADDLALIRLDAPIPADAAVPVRVMNHLPRHVHDHADFYPGKTMTVAGYGQIGDGRSPSRRQQGLFDGATMLDYPDVVRAFGASGESIMCGDSGSGWRVDGVLVGITWQGGCGAVEPGYGNFIPTLSPGGENAAGHSKPDLTAWYGMHLDQDDCATITLEERLATPLYALTGATEACHFGGPDPYTVALRGGGGDPFCFPLDPARLALGRPGEGEGSEWRLEEQWPGWTHRIMPIPGSWPQSYTRGAYLIDFLRRRGTNRVCSNLWPDPSPIYFR